MPRKAGTSGSAGGRRKRPCPGRDLAGGLPDGTAGSASGLGKRVSGDALTAPQVDSTLGAFRRDLRHLGQPGDDLADH